MHIPGLGPLIVGLSIVAAVTMGLAIQRGATCMVAAVDEVYSTGRFTRAQALAEASLWVAGPLALASLLSLGAPAMTGFPAGTMAVGGGILLGLGAYVNSACVFGSIARIGSGDWHYLLTPPAFFLGSLIHANSMIERGVSTPSLAPHTAMWLVVAFFVVSLLVRAYRLAASAKHGQLIENLLQPTNATIAIGITFVILLMTAGPWAYTQVLDQLAHGEMGFDGLQFALFAALFGGSILGGWTNRIAFSPNARTAVRCILGGSLMGLGSALIPGGNDNLILSGLPALQAYAWVAISAMILAIWTGLIAAKNWRKMRPLPQVERRV